MIYKSDAVVRIGGKYYLDGVELVLNQNPEPGEILVSPWGSAFSEMNMWSAYLTPKYGLGVQDGEYTKVVTWEEAEIHVKKGGKSRQPGWNTDLYIFSHRGDIRCNEGSEVETDGDWILL